MPTTRTVVLIREISSCPHDLPDVLEALLDDWNSIGPLPPEEPACPRSDDVERVFDTRVFFDAPSLTALLRNESQKAKESIEGFRRLNHYFPSFLRGLKHGDSIPRFRDVQAIATRTPVASSVIPKPCNLPIVL